MKTKKLLVVALIMVGVFALAGCGGDKDKKDEKAEETGNTSVEMTVTVADNDAAVKVANYTEEEYDKLSDADKGEKMIENLAGKDGKSVTVVNVNDKGILRFAFKDKDGKDVKVEGDPEIKMDALPGIMAVPVNFKGTDKALEKYEGKLAKDDKGYYFSLKDYFTDHKVDDDAFCLIHIEYKVGDKEYKSVAAVLFDAIE